MVFFPVFLVVFFCLSDRTDVFCSPERDSNTGSGFYRVDWLAQSPFRMGHSESESLTHKLPFAEIDSIVSMRNIYHIVASPQITPAVIPIVTFTHAFHLGFAAPPDILLLLRNRLHKRCTPAFHDVRFGRIVSHCPFEDMGKEGVQGRCRYRIAWRCTASSVPPELSTYRAFCKTPSQ